MNVKPVYNLRVGTIKLKNFDRLFTRDDAISDTAVDSLSFIVRIWENIGFNGISLLKFGIGLSPTADKKVNRYFRVTRVCRCSDTLETSKTERIDIDFYHPSNHEFLVYFPLEYERFEIITLEITILH